MVYTCTYIKTLSSGHAFKVEAKPALQSETTRLVAKLCFLKGFDDQPYMLQRRSDYLIPLNPLWLALPELGLVDGAISGLS